jgi:LPXTG-motif cell wall-anchored protein
MGGTEMATTDMSTTESIGSEVEDSSTLANTGGEPWMMALVGGTLAIGALSLRRRIN